MTAPAGAPLPLGRRLALWSFLVVVAVLLLEVGVRLVAAAFFGWRTLEYGTPWGAGPSFSQSVAVHGNAVAGYSKYFPGEKKWVFDTRGQYLIQINNHGFRGPDFTAAKPPGVIRVLTLGASSTFGFEDKDDETYPYFLQRTLTRRGGGRRFEVINFAIPHADSDQIVAMFLNEGVGLSPDVVTIYEGINDAKGAIEAAERTPFWRLAHVSLAVELLHEMSPWVGGIDPRCWGPDIERSAAAHYLGSLETLRAACRQHGIRFIVATQQACSTMIPRDQMAAMRYDDEQRIIRQRLTGMTQHPLGDSLRVVAHDPRALATRWTEFVQVTNAASFLVHAHVIASERTWAPAHDVELVDTLSRLDDHRDSLVTWVHLDARGNKLLAKTLAEHILHPPAPRSG